MKLVRTYEWSRTKREFDISDAIEMECSSDYDGSLERASDAADKTARKLGALIEMLYTNGALKDADVLSLASSFEIAS